VPPEGLDKFKKLIYLIGSRTRDLPACSIAPQTTTLPRALLKVGSFSTSIKCVSRKSNRLVYANEAVDSKEAAVVGNH
jgi:hypothetical protein